MVILENKKFSVARGTSAKRQSAYIDDFRLAPAECMTATIRRFEDAERAVMSIELPMLGLKLFKAQNLRKDTKADAWKVSKVYKQLSSPVSRWIDTDITNLSMILVYSVTIVNGVKNISYDISK